MPRMLSAEAARGSISGVILIMRLRRSSILTKIIVFALIIYASVNLITLRGRIEDARAELGELRRAVAEKELSTAELEYKIENHKDPDVIEDIARSQGLVMPGEIIFYDGGAVSGAVSEPVPDEEAGAEPDGESDTGPAEDD